MNRITIGCQHKLRFVFAGGGTVCKPLEEISNSIRSTTRTRGHVNVVPLQDGLNTVACQIRFVCRVLPNVAQPLKRSRLVAERFQKGVRELGCIESLFDQLADCLFDLNRVQPFAPSIEFMFSPFIRCFC